MSDEVFTQDWESTQVAVQERPESERQKKKKPRRQPRYHVILWNDNDHSYEYVMIMMRELFALPIPSGYKVAKEVDTTGRAICLTTTREHAELKVEQIHAFGADPTIPRCKGSMSASIEPEPA